MAASGLGWGDVALLFLFTGGLMSVLESTVYFCVDVQSGNRFYTAYEPDRYEREYLHVEEVPYHSVPDWGKEQLATE